MGAAGLEAIFSGAGGRFRVGPESPRIDAHLKFKEGGVIMPAFNGTGPLGYGPMTGRGWGYCAAYPATGAWGGYRSVGWGYGGWGGRGRGYGRGFGFGGRRFGSGGRGWGRPGFGRGGRWGW